MKSPADGTKSAVIDSYIRYLKTTEGLRVPYPIETEQELFRAIVRGDSETADMLLNQLLGHIYFYAIDNEEIRSRIAELLVVLTRAAACGGGDVEHILLLSREYLQKLLRIETQEELTRWLASNLRDLMTQVFRYSDVKHPGALWNAIDCMKRKYALPITLEEVARHAGYSPAYFSRIFREDTGMTFKEYLNDLRVEKGKDLLRSTDLTITEIATMTGFSDQSYFCRVFRKTTGSTPEQFRRQTLRKQ